MTFLASRTMRLVGVAIATFVVAGLTPATPVAPDAPDAPDVDPVGVVPLVVADGSVASLEATVPSSAAGPVAVAPDSDPTVAGVSDDGTEATSQSGDWWPKWSSPYFGCWLNCWDFWFDCPCYVYMP
jgi:hypothetical protein